MNQFSDFQKEFRREKGQSKKDQVHQETIESDEEITETFIITKKQKLQPNWKTNKGRPRLRPIEKVSSNEEQVDKEIITDSEEDFEDIISEPK